MWGQGGTNARGYYGCYCLYSNYDPGRLRAQGSDCRQNGCTWVHLKVQSGRLLDSLSQNERVSKKS